MKTASDVILSLEATNSRLDKERIVQHAWDAGIMDFFQGALMAFDSLRTYGVKKVPLIEGEDEPLFQSTLNWDKFVGIATQLERRELTGNAARDVIRAAAD